MMAMSNKTKGRRTAQNSKPRTTRQGGDKEQRKPESTCRQDMSSLNDISWYTHNPGLVQPTASIPYPYRPGMTVPFGNVKLDTTDPQVASFNLRLPGVMALHWVPSIGYSQLVTDPASIAAKEIYAKVRSKFSGALDADAPDFMVYMVCLDSIFSYIGALKRMYRCLDAYSPHNFAVPDQLETAMGLAPVATSRLREQKAGLKYAINQLVAATRKFAMPNVMDFFNRHYWLNDNVYTDTASMNSQMYVFVQTGFYQFALMDKDGNEVEGGASGAKLIDAPWNQDWPSDDGVAYFYQYGRNLIEALANSDDAYTISGYLMRAYEGAPQFAVAELPAIDEPLTPAYVPEVLMQIENAEPLATDTRPSAALINAGVWQNPTTNAVISKPQLLATAVNFEQMTGLRDLRHVVSVRSDAPTVGDTLIASRFKAAWEAVSGGVVVHPGSEILLGARVVRGTETTSAASYRYSTFSQFNVIGLTGATAVTTSDLALLLEISQFDWHPLVWVILTLGTPTTPWNNAQEATLFGDVHNVTALVDDQLREINRVCLFSEFNAFGE